MNWFQRYGIPGSYFFGLTITWVYCFYGLSFEQLKVIGAIASITFLPIGYILSISQQLLYLCIKPLGIHRAAKERTGFDFSFFGFLTNPDDEPTIEAYTYILVVYMSQSLNHEFKEEYWKWITKRMDVLAINFSLIIPTTIYLLTIPIIFFLSEFFNFLYLNNLKEILIIYFIFSSLFFVMIYNSVLLRRQIIIAIAAIYEEFFNDFLERKRRNKEIFEKKS